MKLPAWVQPALNKVHGAIVVGGVAFGASAWASFQTADWKPAVVDLLAGHVGDALGNIGPAIGTGIAAGLMTLAALIKTSFVDKKKVALANNILESKRVSEELRAPRSPSQSNITPVEGSKPLIPAQTTEKPATPVTIPPVDVVESPPEEKK